MLIDPGTKKIIDHAVVANIRRMKASNSGVPTGVKLEALDWQRSPQMNLPLNKLKDQITLYTSLINVRAAFGRDNDLILYPYYSYYNGCIVWLGVFDSPFNPTTD